MVRHDIVNPVRNSLYGVVAAMSPMRDEDLIRDPAIRQAVEARRAAESVVETQSRHWPIGWLLAGFAICMLLIVLIGLIR